MKFLTDENISRFVVLFLRKEGFDVKDIKEEKLYGFSDTKIINLAYSEQRIILTHDKDFAYLAHSKKHEGIILIKCRSQNPEHVRNLLKHFLESDIKGKIKRNLIIVYEGMIHIHKK